MAFSLGVRRGAHLVPRWKRVPFRGPHCARRHVLVRPQPGGGTVWHRAVQVAEWDPLRMGAGCGLARPRPWPGDSWIVPVRATCHPDLRAGDHLHSGRRCATHAAAWHCLGSGGACVWHLGPLHPFRQRMAGPIAAPKARIEVVAEHAVVSTARPGGIRVRCICVRCLVVAVKAYSTGSNSASC